MSKKASAGARTLSFVSIAALAVRLDHRQDVSMFKIISRHWTLRFELYQEWNKHMPARPSLERENASSQHIGLHIRQCASIIHVSKSEAIRLFVTSWPLEFIRALPAACSPAWSSIFQCSALRRCRRYSKYWLKPWAELTVEGVQAYFHNFMQNMLPKVVSVSKYTNFKP